LPNAWNNPFGWLRNMIDGAMTALFAQTYPSILVLEAGIDRPGDMLSLTQWLKPDLVVLTQLPSVPVHVEFFSSPEAVVQEKMQLVSALSPNGLFVYNHDDTIITKQLNQVLQRTIGYGRYSDTEVRIKRDHIVYRDDQPKGVSFEIQVGEETAKVKIDGAVSLAYGYAAAAALAVARELGVSVAIAADALSRTEPTNGRVRLLSGLKGSTIIDDTYNSSPIAVVQALSVLGEIKSATRKIAVLGDMMELGKYSTDEHVRVGSMVPQYADQLITVGIRARRFAEGALQHGMPESAILQYDDVARAGRELQAMLTPGDVVLVKASQSVRLEKIVQEIMAEPERAEELLVRQDSAWQQR
jgi:UDP-N-acetylmuramoyl-tripeptide--D-alanyl-D-alanine ligase